jgi:hypothetical protein
MHIKLNGCRNLSFYSVCIKEIEEEAIITKRLIKNQSVKSYVA